MRVFNGASKLARIHFHIGDCFLVQVRYTETVVHSASPRHPPQGGCGTAAQPPLAGSSDANAATNGASSFSRPIAAIPVKNASTQQSVMFVALAFSQSHLGRGLNNTQTQATCYVNIDPHATRFTCTIHLMWQVACDLTAARTSPQLRLSICNS